MLFSSYKHLITSLLLAGQKIFKKSALNRVTDLHFPGLFF